LKIYSFYLPQYHPIPENDLWWGKDFTEWVSVAAARPRFKGHNQPQIPADLGFYDLRLEETRIAQAKLAAEYGISGFCYYHYWFNGKMLLDLPFNEVLRSGKPDFPFCLCWANESWTRAWDGLEKEILIKQEYSAEDSINHINWLCKAFKDPRYIKVNGKPLLLIYRTDNLPDTEERIRIWRKITKEHGFIDLYLCSVRSNFSRTSEIGVIESGFDAIVEFQPYIKDLPRRSLWILFKLAVNHYANKIITGINLKSHIPLLNENNILCYRKLADRAMARPHPDKYKKFPCVTPSWDNSARKKAATIIQNDDPGIFTAWLAGAFQRVEKYDDDEKIVFINAWNEWAEGCHLEPDKENGRIFLEAIREAQAAHKISAGASEECIPKSLS